MAAAAPAYFWHLGWDYIVCAPKPASEGFRVRSGASESLERRGFGSV